MEFKGVYSVLPTPLKENQEVDIEGLRHLTEFLIKKNIHGVVCLGSNGEFPYFSFDEKKKIITTVLEQVKKRIPVLVGTSCMSTKETLELSKFAKEKGADGFLLALPTYYKPRFEEVYLHYRIISEEINLPIIYYHYPSPTHLFLTPSQIAKISEIDNVVGIKESILNLKEIKKHISLIKKKPFYFFSGTSYLFLSILKMGGSGVICPVPNIIPEIVVSLYENFNKKNLKECKILQDKIFETIPLFSKTIFSPYFTGKLLNLVAKSGFSLPSSSSNMQAVLKETLRQLGHPISSVVRNPNTPLLEGDRENIEKIISEF
jgi:4-hydroxy-tetrahydrodipicolinate synthase